MLHSVETLVSMQNDSIVLILCWYKLEDINIIVCLYQQQPDVFVITVAVAASIAARFD